MSDYDWTPRVAENHETPSETKATPPEAPGCLASLLVVPVVAGSSPVRHPLSEPASGSDPAARRHFAVLGRQDAGPADGAGTQLRRKPTTLSTP
jgi:hypothetical protein